MRIILCYPYAPCELKAGPRVHTLGKDTAGWPNRIMGLDPNEARAPELIEELVYHTRRDDVLIPVSEEAVLPCALVAARQPQIRSLPWPTALACSDRVVQRRVLDYTGMNPEWRAHYLDNDVIKGKTSVESKRVFFRDRRTPWETATAPNWLVSEEFIPGEQFEISGVTVGDKTVVFRPLEQTWDYPGGKVEKYQGAAFERQSFVPAATAIASALGIIGGWDIELRGTPPKIVEVNARLGWEPDNKPYFELLSDDHPYQVLINMLEEGL